MLSNVAADCIHSSWQQLHGGHSHSHAQEIMAATLVLKACWEMVKDKAVAHSLLSGLPRRDGAFCDEVVVDTLKVQGESVGLALHAAYTNMTLRES